MRMPPIFSASPGIERRTRIAGDSFRGVAQLRRLLPFLVLALLLGVLVSGSGGAFSALPSGGAVVTATSFGAGVTVPRPSTTANGDVLVAAVHARLSGNVTITAPSGWTLIRRDSNAPDYRSLTQAVYYKVVGSS